MKLKSLFTSFVVAVLAISWSVPASAYIRISRQGPGGVVQAHWFDSELPLRAIVDPSNNDIAPALALTTVVASAKAWEDVPTSYFTVNPVQYSGAAGEIQPVLALDGQNSVLFEQSGVNFPTAGVIAFVRSIVNLADGHTLDADLVFNDKDYFSTTVIGTPAPIAPPGTLQQTATDLQSVLTHEFGHFFGLDHTSVSGATMVPFVSNSGLQRTLELDDTAGVSAIFPTPAFLSSTGSIRGTVRSGTTENAIFGAHVEAYRLPTLAFATGISTISGELTLRDGHGDWEIKGLPPGDYWVRIVPLDGQSTTAADANIGGVYNGLDTNFEIEFWNGAGESGIGFTDPPNAVVPVTVTAGGTTSGIDFRTNTYPGRVAIDPHGAFESTVTFANNSALGVRFDLPFAVPYTIQSVRFPSVTFNAQFGLPALPATFPSVSLRRMNPATGMPDMAASPLWSATPYVGSANGQNVIPVNVTITEPDSVLFLVVQFPSQTALPGFPANFPFMRMDFSAHDRGFFGASYNLAGAGSILVDRNLAAGMTVQMAANLTPIQAPPASLGMNKRIDQTEFSYLPPANVAADGLPLPPNFLASANLLSRALAVYGTAAVGGAGNPVIRLQPNPSATAAALWAVQAVDKAGNKSVLTNVTLSGTAGGGADDADEPNGRINEATALALPVVNRPETVWPAGDHDYFSFTAQTGQVITATATAVTTAAQAGSNDLDTIMILFDGSGKVVATNDDSGPGTLNSAIIYTVPPPSPASNKAQQKFTLMVADFNGSVLSPLTAARVILPPGYTLNVSTAAPAPAAP